MSYFPFSPMNLSGWKSSGLVKSVGSLMMKYKLDMNQEPAGKEKPPAWT